jgi:hypothetical protein
MVGLVRCNASYQKPQGRHPSMTTKSVKPAAATALQVTNDTLSVELSDGRTIAVPLEWYPRLAHATAKERSGWRFIGGGTGIHWTALDEDISIDNLLFGKPSGESQASIKKWLAARPSRKQRGAPRVSPGRGGSQ